jgi:hypothetical protein
MARSLLLLLRRLVLVGLVVLLLVLAGLLLVLLGGLLAIGGLRGGLIRLSCSNIDVGHRIIFRISTQKYFQEDSSCDDEIK